MKGEDLERVVSEAQLRPGLLVEVIGCLVCGRAHRSIVLARAKEMRSCEWCTRCYGWLTAMPHRPEAHVCFQPSISEARLFIVNPFAEDSTTQKAKRPREVSRAR